MPTFYNNTKVKKKTQLKKDLNIKIGDRIKTERKKRKETQQKLAECICVGRDSIIKWENKSTYPNLESIADLAEHFNCDIDYLFCKISQPTHTLTDICKETKLTEQAVENIKELSQDKFSWGGYSLFNREHIAIDVLNDLLSTDLFGMLLLDIAEYKRQLRWLDNPDFMEYKMTTKLIEIVRKICEYDKIMKEKQNSVPENLESIREDTIKNSKK